MSEIGLPEKLVTVDAALRDALVAHAFGGAIALAYYAEPRATIDIDCNVFVRVDEHRRVTDALREVGVDVGLDPVRLDADGKVRLWWGRTPINLFFAYDPFHDAMAVAARQVAFRDTTIPILSAEHLVVCKAVFDRRKDWLDIEQVLVSVPGFDAAEVRRWLPRIVGVDDARAERFDGLARTLLGR